MGREPRSTTQLDKWKSEVRDVVKTKTKKRLIELYGEHAAGDPYFVKSGKTPDRSKHDFYIGSPDEIAEMVLVPKWTQAGDWKLFDVDHKIDYQLGGKDDISEPLVVR